MRRPANASADLSPRYTTRTQAAPSAARARWALAGIASAPPARPTWRTQDAKTSPWVMWPWVKSKSYPQVNIRTPTKIDSNGWCTYPKMVPLVLTHSHVGASAMRSNEAKAKSAVSALQYNHPHIYPSAPRGTYGVVALAVHHMFWLAPALSCNIWEGVQMIYPFIYPLLTPPPHPKRHHMLSRTEFKLSENRVLKVPNNVPKLDCNASNPQLWLGSHEGRACSSRHQSQIPSLP